MKKLLVSATSISPADTWNEYRRWAMSPAGVSLPHFGCASGRIAIKRFLNQSAVPLSRTSNHGLSSQDRGRFSR